MLEAVFLIWLVVGFVGLIFYSVTESETPGLFESAFLVLFGPLIFIWLFFSLINDREKKPKKKPKRKPKQVKLSEWTPSATPEQIDKYNKAIKRLKGLIEAREKASEYPSKQEIVEIQRLGDLARKQEMKSIIDEGAVIEALAWGLRRIDGTYPGKDRAMGGRRKTAITATLENICARAGKEVPSVNPVMLGQESKEAKPLKEAKVAKKKNEQPTGKPTKQRGVVKDQKTPVKKTTIKTPERKGASFDRTTKKAKFDTKSTSKNQDAERLKVIEISEHTNYLHNPVTWAYFFTKEINFLLESAWKQAYVRKGRDLVANPDCKISSKWITRDFHDNAIPVFEKFLSLAESQDYLKSINQLVYRTDLVKAIRNKGYLKFNLRTMKSKYLEGTEFLGLTKRTTLDTLKRKYFSAYEKNQSGKTGSTQSILEINKAFCLAHELLCATANTNPVPLPVSAEDFTYRVSLSLISVSCDDWDVDNAYKRLIQIRDNQFWGSREPFESKDHYLLHILFDLLQTLVKRLYKAGRLEAATDVFNFAKFIESGRKKNKLEIITDPKNPYTHWQDELEQVLAGKKRAMLRIMHPRQAQNALRLGLINETKYKTHSLKFSDSEERGKNFTQQRSSNEDLAKMEAISVMDLAVSKDLPEPIQDREAFSPFAVEQVLKCAYLAGMSEGVDSEDILISLGYQKPIVSRLISIKGAVKHYESTDDFEAALQMRPAEQAAVDHSKDTGLPSPETLEFCANLVKKFSKVKTKSKFADLLEQEASHIKEDYVQLVAWANAITVLNWCEAPNASQVVAPMLKLWSRGLIQSSFWFEHYVVSILNGVPPTVENLEAFAKRNLRDMLGEDVYGTFTEEQVNQQVQNLLKEEDHSGGATKKENERGKKSKKKKPTNTKSYSKQEKDVKKKDVESEEVAELLRQFLTFPETTSDLKNATEMEINLNTKSPEDAVRYVQEAVNILTERAENGDAKAQWALGAQYELGLIFEKSDSKAFEYYLAAAEQEFAPSQHDIAIYYKEGRGVEQDLDSYVQWMTRAANQGYPIALYKLGMAYELGDGVDENQELSSKYYRLAAEKGDPASQTNIGGNYLSGRGVPQDYGEAVKWFKLAADNGVSGAQFNLGNCYLDGLGVKKNSRQATKWYRAAAEQGNMDAKYNLAVCYVQGKGVQQDKQKALELFNELANQGDDSVLGKIELLENELNSKS